MPTGFLCAWKLPARFAQEAIEPMLGFIRFCLAGFKLPYVCNCVLYMMHTDRCVHTYTRTYIHACMHTYIHKDRQTLADTTSRVSCDPRTHARPLVVTSCHSRTCSERSLGCCPMSAGVLLSWRTEQFSNLWDPKYQNSIALSFGLSCHDLLLPLAACASSSCSSLLA